MMVVITATLATTFKGATKSYNSNNQQSGTGFTYDNNVNPTAYNGVSLSFDPENHLLSHGSALTAGYRGDGLRAWKQASSSTTYFLYDGTNPVVELNSSGSVIATNTFGSRGLVSRRVSTVSVLYAFDSEGNLSQRTDASANVLSDHSFDAYGVSLNGTLTEPFGYKAQFGYYTDHETGLQLLTHRYYDPSTGRFLTRDPISYAGGINLYAYVQNNPGNVIDPSGLIGIIDYEALRRKIDQILSDYGPGAGGGAGGTIAIAGTVAVMDGPEPGPADALALAYLMWACFASPAHPSSPAIPLARPTPTTLIPPPPVRPEAPNTCDSGMEQCLDNPWQPSWNRGLFGPRKDCGSCYRECKNSGGVWPNYKCPRP